MEPLNPAAYRDIVRRALDEDIGEGDITTAATVSSSQRARGVFLAKADCVVAGLDVAFEVFRQVAEKGTGVFSDVTSEASKTPGSQASLVTEMTPVPFFNDGDRCRAGEEIAEVVGPAAVLLTAERTALNFLQRLSGIATRARQFVDAAGGRITVLDTRKTTPTLRVLEKYAVRTGCATNHRTGLHDAVLIKDNHIRLAGSVAAAVDRTRRGCPGLPIEIEAQSLAQVDEALAAGAEMILLDNLSIEEIRQAVGRARGRARTEISGGVTLDRIPELAATGADFVSVGSLTHSAPAIDISFELEPL